MFLVAYLEPQKPPIVIRPALGSMLIFPPLNERGKSFERSSVKNGVLPFGNVNRSRPARRVEVASMRMLLLSVREKYPGEASPRTKSDSIVVPSHNEWDAVPSVLSILKRSRPARLGVHVSNPPGQIKGMISKFP